MSLSRTFFAAAVASCLSGCSFSLIDAPALPSTPVVCPKAAPAPVVAPKLSLPEIPGKVRIVIDGDNVEADAGGEMLLRAYVEVREALD